jgi:hypothetical protein
MTGLADADLLAAVGFEDVALLEIVEPFEYKATFVAIGDLTDVVFKVFETEQFADGQPLAIPGDMDFCVPGEFAPAYVEASDAGGSPHGEYGPDGRFSLYNVPVDRLEQALQGLVYILD